MPGRRLFCLGGAAALLCGCSGRLFDLPPGGDLAAAEAEIGTLPPPPRRTMSGHEAGAALRRIAARLEGPAREVCTEIGASRCAWYVEGSRDRQVNAFAAGGGRIVVHRGILEAARNDEEVAFVVAHEMAHQAADHVADGERNMQVGAAAGAVALGVLGLAAVTAGAPPSFAMRNFETGAALGARIGRIAYSQEQEREADYLAALILHRAGYDLGTARGFLMTMARTSTRRETGLFDTHPAGPERLAAFDQAALRIRASDGALPARAGQALSGSTTAARGSGAAPSEPTLPGT